MEILIDDNYLEKRNITEEEFLVLYASCKNKDIRKVLKTLANKGYINDDIIPYNNIEITEKGDKLLEDLLLNNNTKVIHKDTDLTKLVMKMKDLYPKGKKPGTNYMWRCSTPELIKRIKVLITKYDFNYTDDQILEATRKYVKSFDGNYKTMRLLKYFIMKIEKDADGNAIVTSDLMSLLENEDSENISDWTTRLI